MSTVNERKTALTQRGEGAKEGRAAGSFEAKFVGEKLFDALLCACAPGRETPTPAPGGEHV